MCVCVKLLMNFIIITESGDANCSHYRTGIRGVPQSGTGADAGEAVRAGCGIEQ